MHRSIFQQIVLPHLARSTLPAAAAAISAPCCSRGSAVTGRRWRTSGNVEEPGTGSGEDEWAWSGSASGGDADIDLSKLAESSKMAQEGFGRVGSSAIRVLPGLTDWSKPAKRHSRTGRPFYPPRQIPTAISPESSTEPEPPDKGSGFTYRNTASHADITEEAMRKILELHHYKPEADGPVDTKGDAPVPQVVATAALPNPSAARGNAPPLPPLPPSIAQLLERKHNRVAVFHILNTPSYHSNTALVKQVIDILVINHAHNLADRLRRSLDRPRKRRDPETAEEQMLLNGTLRAPGEMRGNDFWRTHGMEFITGVSLPAGLTSKQRHTMKCNDQLVDLLSRSKLARAIGPLDETPAVPPGTPPPATPRLLLLNRLLRTIHNLEKRHNFQPDRVTANIILRCWMRCGLAGIRWSRYQDVEGADDPYRVYTDRQEVTRIAVKQPSKHYIGSKEIMLIWKIIATVMDRHVRGIDPLVLPEDMEEEVLDVDRHVRPFADLIAKSLRRIDDKHSMRKVRKWEEEIRAIMEDINEIRWKLRAYRTEAAAAAQAEAEAEGEEEEVERVRVGSRGSA